MSAKKKVSGVQYHDDHNDDANRRNERKLGVGFVSDVLWHL